MASAAGAVVIGAAGGQEKLELARDLGATFVVDYRVPEWANKVKVDAGGIDVVFDGVGGNVGRAAFNLVDPGGRLVSFGLASGSFTQVGEGEAATKSWVDPGDQFATPHATQPWRAVCPLLHSYWTGCYRTPIRWLCCSPTEVGKENYPAGT
jgi:NADPH2:quinone reductase